MTSAPAMTKYTVDCPDELWDAWKETVPRSINLNDGLLKIIARETLDQRGDDLDDRTRETIEEILNR